MRVKCKGKSSANQYGNGCRCVDCREAWRVHALEGAVKKRKGVRRDAPIPEHDAFTREQILRARSME